jgi:hypothetical protein
MMKTIKKMMSKKALMGLGVMLLVCVTVAFAAVNVKGLIVDALTGFTVAGAAPNNQVICGNGTVGTYQATCGTAVSPITGTLTFSVAQGPLASNTCQAFTVTMSAAVPSGSVVIANIDQGTTFAGIVGGLRYNITGISGAAVTVNFCNDWNSAQGWGPTVMNFKVQE